MRVPADGVFVEEDGRLANERFPFFDDWPASSGGTNRRVTPAKGVVGGERGRIRGCRTHDAKVRHLAKNKRGYQANSGSGCLSMREGFGLIQVRLLFFSFMELGEDGEVFEGGGVAGGLPAGGDIT